MHVSRSGGRDMVRGGAVFKLQLGIAGLNHCNHCQGARKHLNSALAFCSQRTRRRERADSELKGFIHQGSPLSLLDTKLHLEAKKAEPKGLLQPVCREAAHPTSLCDISPFLLVQKSRPPLPSRACAHTSPGLQYSPAAKPGLLLFNGAHVPGHPPCISPNLELGSWSLSPRRTDPSSWALGNGPHLPGPAGEAAMRG